MSLTVRALSLDAVAPLLALELRCRGSLSALRAAVIADHIRTQVSASFSRSEDERVARPIHTSRLFAALERNVRFLFDAKTARDGFADQYDAFEFVRDQLVACGDICAIGDGYWIPGPLRAVQDSSGNALLFGGAPTHSLPRSISAQIRAAGPARHLTNTVETANVPVEGLADWVGWREPLSAWTEKTLTWAGTALQPQAEIEDDTLEIYAPDVHRMHRRLGLWIDAKDFQEPSPTLRLFRPKTAARWTFDRPDYLGLFAWRTGGAQLTHAVRIPHETARRLQFGFDQKLQTPRTIILRRSGDAYRVDIKYPPLPYPESRILGVGWREPDQLDALFFDDLALPALEGIAGLLGMRLHHT